MTAPDRFRRSFRGFARFLPGKAFTRGHRRRAGAWREPVFCAPDEGAQKLLVVAGRETDNMGAAGYLGGWYGGLAGVPAAAAQAFATAADPAAATAARHAALAAVTALLLGLRGGVVGGSTGRRADDLQALSAAARPSREGRLVMVLILLWLLGVPLSLILILFLLGVVG